MAGPPIMHDAAELGAPAAAPPASLPTTPSATHPASTAVAIHPGAPLLAPPAEAPAVGGADLDGADLDGADLGGTDFDGADSGGADSGGADSGLADLDGARAAVSPLAVTTGGAVGDSRQDAPPLPLVAMLLHKGGVSRNGCATEVTPVQQLVHFVQRVPKGTTTAESRDADGGPRDEDRPSTKLDEPAGKRQEVVLILYRTGLLMGFSRPKLASPVISTLISTGGTTTEQGEGEGVIFKPLITEGSGAAPLLAGRHVRRDFIPSMIVNARGTNPFEASRASFCRQARATSSCDPGVLASFATHPRSPSACAEEWRVTATLLLRLWPVEDVRDHLFTAPAERWAE